MADKQISQLVEATNINGEDLFVMQQGGTAKKLSGQRLSDYVYRSAAEQIERVNETVAEAQEAVDELEEQKNTIAQTIADMAELGTDTTLTTPGMAADAKATGDRIEGIEDIAAADLELLSAKPGNIVSFYNGTDNVPVKSLKLDIDPVQDLHGYDNPWPGGGGKNKLPMTVSGMKAINTSGTWSGNVYTENGVSYTLNTDDGENIVSIKANGTATAGAYSQLYFVGGSNYVDFGLPTGTYIFSDDTTSDAIVKFIVVENGDPSYGVDDISYAFTSGAKYRIFVRISSAVSNTTFYPMLRASSESDSTFVPYSNICPIIGWTGANVTRAGKNLFRKIGNIYKFDEFLPSGTHVYSKYFSSTSITSSLYGIKTNGSHVTVGSVSSSGINDITLTDDYIGLYISASATHDIENYGGTVVVSLEPFTKSQPYADVVSIEFPSEAGTVYSGTLDVTTGLLTIDKKALDAASYTAYLYTNQNKRRFEIPLSNFDAADSSALPVTSAFCSHFENANSLAANTYGKFSLAVISTSAYFTFYDSESVVATEADFNAYLQAQKTAGTPVLIIYPLATPVTYQLSPTQVRTLLGENHVWADTGDITELIYRAVPDPKVVENADQLLSDTGTTEKVPYLFRKTGGDAEHASRLTDKIVGGTIAWNQLISNVPASGDNNGITFTNNSDGTITANGTATADTSGMFAWSSKNLISDHKYYMCGCPSGGSSSTYFMNDGYSHFDTGNGYIGTLNLLRCYLSIKSGTTVNNIVFKPQIFDLTQMFGSAVADRIYAMEQATAGAGVAFFKSLFPKPYYAYNAGELMSVNTSAHVTSGFNQWDEEWAGGYYDVADGEAKSSTSWVRSANAIPCVPKTNYYCCAVTTRTSSFGAILFYDKAGNYLGSYVTEGNYKNHIFQTPDNCYYMNFYVAVEYRNENTPICFNISGAKDGTYEPYESHTYPLDSSLTLRGIPKLDSNNKVYYDGDTYESDGKVTRRYGIVDMGTLTWSYTGAGVSQARFLTTISGIKRASTNYGTAPASNMICKLYRTSSVYAALESDKEIAGYSNTDEVLVRDSAYTDAATFKSAMSGVYLVYELATPTTETANPFTNPQICSPYGTEEYVDEREVAVPVGHDTFYHEDLKGKIEGLPWDLSMIAPIENGVTASQAYAQGKFFIRNNQFCKAKTSIASGASFTLGTNYEVTTIAAELFAALS